MKHTISNEHLEVSILQKGTEICSIRSLKTGREYMWQANPDIWGSHAPVLFPAIGAIKNKEATINGQSYAVPRHGFVRHNEDIVLIDQQENSLTYRLEYSEKTLKVFPFRFRFLISFTLEENRLTVAHEVHNQDNQTMYFCLGGHPAFACPVDANTSYEDYYIQFEHPETADTTRLSDDGLLTDRKERILDNTDILPLRNDLFDEDALIFRELKSRKAALRSKKSDHAVVVRFDDFSFLGIWAKPNAPFVCIEPWLGIADHENTDGDFAEKDGIVSLPAGEVFTADFSIEILET